MNDARKKVEEFKKSDNSNEMSRVRFSMKLPENIQNLDYHAKNRAESQALDDAIAQHLGVTINDHESWPDEQGKMLAQEWASKLPDA